MIEVIAEIGINWNGNLDLAKEMILEAKCSGADVAKFQIYDPKIVLDPEHPYLKPYWDLILKTEISKEQVGILKQTCDDANIEFMASVFRPEVVEWTEEVGMKRYKIASRSIYDWSLAEAIYTTGKPVIVSYGYYQQGWVPHVVWDRMIARQRSEPAAEFTKLYCVSKYPTPLSEVDFFDGGEKSLFQQGVFQGFSDHTEGITTSIVAMSLGATVIEKHVTMDKKFDGPDHRWSISFSELEQLCDMRDQIEEILG